MNDWNRTRVLIDTAYERLRHSYELINGTMRNINEINRVNTLNLERTIKLDAKLAQIRAMDADSPARNG